MVAEKREESLLELGRILHDARCAKGYKRDVVAEQVGITKRFLTAIENGEKRPSYETLREIIRALGISADMVFYPELAEDTDAQQIMRLYEGCTDHDKHIIKAAIDAARQHK